MPTTTFHNCSDDSPSYTCLQKRISDLIGRGPPAGRWYTCLASEIIEVVRGEPVNPTLCSCEQGSSSFHVEYAADAGDPTFGAPTHLQCLQCARVWIREFVVEDWQFGSGHWVRALDNDGDNQAGGSASNMRVYGGDYSDIAEAHRQLRERGVYWDWHAWDWRPIRTQQQGWESYADRTHGPSIRF